jgi:UDP-2-acetamido-2,6-beta-L-arabino-hexul-4-ose reductase
MQVLVTGADGFIGANLCLALREYPDKFNVRSFGRHNSEEQLFKSVEEADVIIHLAGENRPNDVENFFVSNVRLTDLLCQAVSRYERHIPILFASSTQAALGNPYGTSKKQAEQLLEKLAKDHGNPVAIYRLPGIFGKWARPNYNSVVATFCFNIARDIPIDIHDRSAIIKLAYIDDLIAGIRVFLDTLPCNGLSYQNLSCIYDISIGELADKLLMFRESRNNLSLSGVGLGLDRALYSTYVSYLPFDQFSYPLPVYGDDRGIFVEVLKTNNSGQFSYFTLAPTISRGGHYHHTKTEKFLVLKGSLKFQFKSMKSGEIFEFEVSSRHPRIVDTIPGWSHSVTNVGSCDAIVMLWANEVFDRENPDTIKCNI